MMKVKWKEDNETSGANLWSLFLQARNFFSKGSKKMDWKLI